jgi:putative inorganic carbon (HCO3(-)) transporter
MSQDAQNLPLPAPRLPVIGDKLKSFKGNRIALGLALAGAAGAALFACSPSTLAILVAATVLVLSATENEEFLLFIILATPFGWMLPASVPVRNLHVVLHGLVVVGFFAGRIWRGQLHIKHLFHPVVSWASLVFFCVTVAPTILVGEKSTHESVRADLDLVAYIGFYFVILAWVDSRERVRKVLYVLLFSTIVTALYAAYQELIGGFGSLWLYLYPPNDYFEMWEGRAASFLGNGNSLAGYLNLILPFALACYILGRGKWKVLGACTFVLGSFALLSTQSIGGLLGFFAILILAIFYFPRSTSKKLGLFVSLCALIGLYYLLRTVLNPNHTDEQLGTDALTRLTLWAVAWNLFTQSPVLGVGWGNFANLYVFDLPSAPGVLASHSLYLQLLSETGVVGFLSFLYFIVRSWFQAKLQFRSSRDFLDAALAFGVLGAILSVLVHGTVDFLFQVNAQFGTLFWVLLALLVASGQLQGKTENSPHMARSVLST